MGRSKKYFLFLIILSLFQALGSLVIAQSKKIDSLKNVLNTTREDTGTIKTLMKLGDIFQNINPDTAIVYHTRAMQLGEKLHEPLRVQEAISQIGSDLTALGEYQKALSLFNGILVFIGDKTNDRKALQLKAKVCLNMGGVYFFHADNTNALTYFLKGLQIAETINDRNIMARGYLNVGLVNRMQSEYSRATDNDLKALKIAEELKNKRLQGKVLGELGNVCKEKADFKLALDYYFKTLAIFEALGNKSEIAVWLSNIGTVLLDQARYGEALDYYLRTLTIAEELGDKKTLAITSGNLGLLYFYTKQYNESEKYLTNALAINHELQALEGIQYQEETYSRLDSARGNFKGALEHYKKFIAARDSITNEENTKNQTRAEMKFEFDKKEAAAKAEQEKKDAVASADKKKQGIILWSVSAFGLLVLGFALFAYRSFLQKKRVNEEITLQKELIEEKQKEILDSIYYARRIQRSLIPTDKYIEKLLSKGS